MHPCKRWISLSVQKVLFVSQQFCSSSHHAVLLMLKFKPYKYFHGWNSCHCAGLVELSCQIVCFFSLSGELSCMLISSFFNTVTGLFLTIQTVNFNWLNGYTRGKATEAHVTNWLSQRLGKFEAASPCHYHKCTYFCRPQQLKGSNDGEPRNPANWGRLLMSN